MTPICRKSSWLVDSQKSGVSPTLHLPLHATQSPTPFMYKALPPRTIHPFAESLFHGTTYQNPTYVIKRCPFLGYWELMPKPLPCSQKTRLTITYVFVTAYATPITHIQPRTYTGCQERGHTEKGEKKNGGLTITIVAIRKIAVQCRGQGVKLEKTQAITI